MLASCFIYFATVEGIFFRIPSFLYLYEGYLCIRGSLYPQPWQQYSRGKRIKKHMQLNCWKQCQTVLKQLINKIFI